MRTPAQSLGRIFAPLIAIALLSIVGLFSALTGDGVRDLLSWVALGVPVLVLPWAWRTRRS